MNGLCKIDTGDWVGSLWKGPVWTPYAEAIASEYAVRKPWYFLSRVNLGAPPSFITVLTEPFENDVLIMGAHAAVIDISSVNLQVTHDATGIPWVSPTALPFGPITAFAGLSEPMKFPEAFFLPAHTRLKLEWSVTDPSASNPDPSTITFIGVELNRPRGGKTPEWVTMPNGDPIRVGSRLPLFLTMAMGQRTGDTYAFPPNSQHAQYHPAIDCNAEIHDANLNFFFSFGQTPVTNLLVKLAFMGVNNSWTPRLTPVTAIYGRGGAAYPAQPFPMPYLLPKGSRIRASMINSNNALTLNNGLLTLRGVRLCDY